MAEKKLSILHIGVYLLIFFAAWSVYAVTIYPVLLDSLNYTAVELVDSAIKLLLWTLPAVLLIRRYQDSMYVGLSEMLTAKPKWFISVPILLLALLIPLAEALVLHGEIKVRPDFIPAALIGAVAFVGITEEAVFRGFLLNALLKKKKLWPAVVINAVLFALIHYPGYASQGLGFSAILFNSVTLLIPLSIFFAFSFINTRNIIVPMTLHMTWNLLTIIFVA
ncbi:MAG: CPBP family intramembrane metalloprotease [Clostridiales bacterium]|nr:CPBP family intramembrane metalloprotease [Clostridiales bacterium]